MGTRSLVGIKNGEYITYSYVHFDGYLEGVGLELQAFTTAQDVTQLILEGDRSCLDKDELYGTGPECVLGEGNFIRVAIDRFCDWYYLFCDDQWFCGSTHRGPLGNRFVPYKDAVAMYAV